MDDDRAAAIEMRPFSLFDRCVENKKLSKSPYLFRGHDERAEVHKITKKVCSKCE